MFLTTDKSPPPPGGHSTFFRVCGPDFRSVGLANWHLPLKRGLVNGKFPNLGACELKDFQIWGLVSWKIPNLGACELKFGWKLRLSRLKFPQKGSCELTLLLKWDPCERQDRREKGVFRAAHPHTPFLGQCPPGSPLPIIISKRLCHAVPGTEPHAHFLFWNHTSIYHHYQWQYQPRRWCVATKYKRPMCHF